MSRHNGNYRMIAFYWYVLCIGILLSWHANDVMFLGCQANFGTQKNYATGTLISVLQTFRSWTATSHIRPPKSSRKTSGPNTEASKLASNISNNISPPPPSRMLHDILDDDHLQWNTPLINHYTNFMVRRGHLVIGSLVCLSVSLSVCPSFRPAYRYKQSAIFKVWVMIQ